MIKEAIKSCGIKRVYDHERLTADDRKYLKKMMTKKRLTPGDRRHRKCEKKLHKLNKHPETHKQWKKMIKKAVKYCGIKRVYDHENLTADDRKYLKMMEKIKSASSIQKLFRRYLKNKKRPLYSKTQALPKKL